MGFFEWILGRWQNVGYQKIDSSLFFKSDVRRLYKYKHRVCVCAAKECVCAAKECVCAAKECVCAAKKCVCAAKECVLYMQRKGVYVCRFPTLKGRIGGKILENK